MRFKYRFADLECHYCLAMENEDGGCPYDSCPHITENLKDLLCDPAFIDAVTEAENCDSPHRVTLLILQSQKAHIQKKAKTSRFDEKPVCSYKPDCMDCPYPSVGFVCYSPKDGSCLKTDMAAIGRRQPIGRCEQRTN